MAVQGINTVLVHRVCGDWCALEAMPIKYTTNARQTTIHSGDNYTITSQTGRAHWTGQRLAMDGMVVSPAVTGQRKCEQLYINGPSSRTNAIFN